MKEVNVLFVDDEMNVLNAIQRLFLNEAYGVVVTADPAEALAIVEREKIKVVLSDQRMPVVTGVDLLQQIKNSHPDIVRILFTGYADLNAAEKAINVSEVFRFINKPWDAEELKAIVRNAMKHFDLTVDNRRLFEETIKQNKKLQIMYDIQKEFSSTMSHELRTPLSSIKAGIDIVLSGTAGEINADQKEFLGKVKENVDRLNRLINDILDLAHLESGKTHLHIKLGDLNLTLASVVKDQVIVARNKGLYLNMSLDPALADVSFDSDKIIQVMNNLIMNALKFTDTGGVTVASIYRPVEKQVEVRVTDTGPGIGPEDVEKLFHKFKQLGDPALRKTGGTGLGLAICLEIVRQHNGTISVASEKGKGSTFYFILPV